METRNAQYSTAEYSKEIPISSALPLSAVSWGAIFAGAAAAAALSLILLLLGVGLGLSSVSPWAHSGVSGTTFGVTTILWITITSLIASAVGGYLAGRLRTRWIATPTDEIYFRDTAHGFLAWVLATLATATLLASTITSMLSGAAQTGAALASAGIMTATTVAATTENDEPNTESDNTLLPYFIDTLLRKDPHPASNTGSTDSTVSTSDASTPAPAPAPATDTVAVKAEVARIFANALAVGTLPAEDVHYVGQVVAQHSNLSQQDAEKRVTDIFNALQTKLDETEIAARRAADQARKASAYGSLWLFISLLIGAFIASLTAVYGGRQRDCN